MAAFFVSAAYAECEEPQELHSILVKSGFVPFAYSTADQGYLLTIYIRGEETLLTAEDNKIACVLSHGGALYLKEGFNI